MHWLGEYPEMCMPPGLDLGSGKFNLKLKKKIQPVVEAPSFKLQA